MFRSFSTFVEFNTIVILDPMNPLRGFHIKASSHHLHIKQTLEFIIEYFTTLHNG